MILIYKLSRSSDRARVDTKRKQRLISSSPLSLFSSSWTFHLSLSVSLDDMLSNYGDYVDTINQFYLPEWLTVELVAANFITFTPLFSYGSTVLSIYRTQSSLGFSLDICATMIIASVLRIAYYFIIPYEPALLRQSCVMIFIQAVLLKVSLLYRPKNYDVNVLKTGHSLWEKLSLVWSDFLQKSEIDLNACLTLCGEVVTLIFIHFVRFFDPNFRRLGNFWQWNDEKYFWRFLFRFTIGIVILTALMQNVTQFGELLGSIGLFVESLLPLPQILLLNALKTIEGFKLILLVSWLCGDFMKISYLVFGAKNISGMFIFFAVFQMGLDFYIAGQYIHFKFFYKPGPEELELQNLA